MTIFGIALSLGQAILFIFLGAVVIISALVGGVLLLAKAIADGVEHNRNTCGCGRCQAWRLNQAQIARQNQKNPIEEVPSPEKKTLINKPLPSKAPITDNKRRFISTVELQVGDTVFMRTERWIVKEKLVTFLGIFVSLQNAANPKMKTKKHRIRNEDVERKIWSIRPDDWSH